VAFGSSILAATKLYSEREPTAVEAVELGGVRTAVAVPMLKDNKVIGIITIVRQEVCPFVDKQIALVTSFAAQSRHRHRERAVAPRPPPADH
jgi:hypothetical protein